MTRTEQLVTDEAVRLAWEAVLSIVQENEGHMLCRDEWLPRTLQAAAPEIARVAREQTVRHVAEAVDAAIENASTRAHFIRRLEALLDELGVSEARFPARADDEQRGGEQ